MALDEGAVQMTPRYTRFRKLTSPPPLPARLFWVLLATALCSATCKTPTPIVSDPTPTAIVSQNALDAFQTFLTGADAPSLQTFRSHIANATTRQDLVQGWVAVPGLQAKGPDFLQRHVFDKAMAEARWPKTPGLDLEPAFVSGVREAVDAFLREVT